MILWFLCAAHLETKQSVESSRKLSMCVCVCVGFYACDPPRPSAALSRTFPPRHSNPHTFFLFLYTTTAMLQLCVCESVPTQWQCVSATIFQRWSNGAKLHYICPQWRHFEIINWFIFFLYNSLICWGFFCCLCQNTKPFVNKKKKHQTFQINMKTGKNKNKKPKVDIQ